MSNIISCRSVTKSIGVQVLFQDVDLVIAPGDKVGLIGPNGSGKSTLLRILCGLDDADHGDILMAKHATTGYLAQSEVFHEDISVEDNLLAVFKNHLVDQAEIHTRVQTLLSKALFADPSQPVKNLSGGWRKRLAICMALLPAPDLLVMDEPTNHLDIEGILWLENILGGGLRSGPSAFIVVSHDRHFLESCCRRTIELSAVYPHGSFQVNGPYSTFLDKRHEYLQQQQQSEERLANKVRRETEWLRRGPKARTTKAQFRIDEAHRLEARLSEVRGRNRATGQVNIDFDSTGRKTRKLLEAISLSKSFDSKVLFNDIDIVLSPGTKLGLLGNNGCGKSTLMKVLAHADHEQGAEVDSGSIRCANDVRIVSFDQRRESLDQKITLRRALAPDGDAVVCQGRSVHVVSWAKRFLFRADQLETPVGELSGGEQARILIASLMCQQADILLLDEPTNDLDIASLDVLEKSLLQFPGAVVLVTHDRYLLDRVCSRVLGFDGVGGVTYYADYEQWLADVNAIESRELGGGGAPVAEKNKAKRSRPKGGKLSYLDQREYDQMEEKILLAETRAQELQDEMGRGETISDSHRLQACWRELESLQQEISGMYERWSELEERMLAP